MKFSEKVVLQSAFRETVTVNFSSLKRRASSWKAVALCLCVFVQGARIFLIPVRFCTLDFQFCRNGHIQWNTTRGLVAEGSAVVFKVNFEDHRVECFIAKKTCVGRNSTFSFIFILATYTLDKCSSLIQPARRLFCSVHHGGLIPPPTFAAF